MFSLCQSIIYYKRFLYVLCQKSGNLYAFARSKINIQTPENISDPHSISVTSFFAFRQGILFIGASKIGYTAANRR